MKIAKVLTSARYGFKYAQTEGAGHPDADHASAWSFDDEQVVRDRHWHCKSGDTVLDIGAAFGSYTLPALAMGARVVAFSPADLDTELLNINLGLNPELARRCLVVRDGIYSRDGYFDPDNSRFMAEEKWNSYGGGAHWLHCCSLDSFLASRPGIDRVDFIKMDIEGAELEALKGAEQCLRRWKPKLLIECHEFHVKDIVRQVHGFLTGLGVGYSGQSFPHCAVSHSYYEVR